MLRIVKNMCIQIRYAQFYTIKQKCTVKCYEHTNQIIENIFLSPLITFRTGFVLDTNIYVSQFSNKLEMNS